MNWQALFDRVAISAAIITLFWMFLAVIDHDSKIIALQMRVLALEQARSHGGEEEASGNSMVRAVYADRNSSREAH